MLAWWDVAQHAFEFCSCAYSTTVAPQGMLVVAQSTKSSEICEHWDWLESVLIPQLTVGLEALSIPVLNVLQRDGLD